MSSMILVNNAYITLEYIPDEQLIYHTIHQPIASQPEVFKSALNLGTETLRQHGATKWLSDDRRNGPLPPEMIEWAITDWNMRTIQAGWKFWANVVPEAVAAAGTLTPVIDNLYQFGLKMRVFTQLEDAHAWLKRQSVPQP
ncbi:MAG: hypothetical protein U0694_01230 [Anaerolineae bacterium]